MAAGFLVAARASVAADYWGVVVVFMCVMAAGMALATGPTDSVLAALPESRAGVGSAVNDTTPELGGALGVAVVGSVMSWYYGAAGAGLDRARRRARNPAVRQNRARGRARSSRPGPCAGGDGRRRRPPGSAGRAAVPTAARRPRDRGSGRRTRDRHPRPNRRGVRCRPAIRGPNAQPGPLRAPATRPG